MAFSSSVSDSASASEGGLTADGAGHSVSAVTLATFVPALDGSTPLATAGAIGDAGLTAPSTGGEGKDRQKDRSEGENRLLSY